MPHELPTTRLTCHAPHPDPAKRGDPCGAPLGVFPGAYEFVTTAERMPAELDDPACAWVRCSWKRCATWNSFRIVVPPAPVVLPATAAAPVLTLEERLAQLPEEQQQAVLALASGLGATQTARLVGVDRKTVSRWGHDPEFLALRRAVAPAIRDANVSVALAGFFEILERDRKKGVAHNHRWFLARTVFAEFERTKAAAGASSVSVNVQQSQQLVQASIQQLWERKTA